MIQSVKETSHITAKPLFIQGSILVVLQKIHGQVVLAKGVFFLSVRFSCFFISVII